MRAVARRAVVSAAVAAGILLALAVAETWVYLERPYAGWSGRGVTVELPRGLGAGAMVRRLHDAGVLRNPRLVTTWVVLSGRAGRLKAGEYRFERPMSPAEVVGILERGEVVLHAVTLPEGIGMGEVARRLEDAGVGVAAELLEAFHHPDAVRELDPEATDLEGYLFPDTYHLPRGQPPRRIASALVERFREITGPDYLEAAGTVGLSLREAVTLASMIEKETSVPAERWRISRVFHNRLRRGMKLQCDPTVIYALERAGRATARLTYADLQFDSPWNTYVVAGLPPGPICNPGRASLDAAVHPADGDELYFVASPGGGHEFSRDLPSHLEAVRRWRRSQRSSR